MRRVFISSVIFILFFNVCKGQKIVDNNVDQEYPKVIHFGAGAFYDATAAINTLTIEGYKNQPAFSALGDLGFGLSFLNYDKYGVMINFVISKRPFGVYPFNKSDEVSTLTYSATSINPMFYLWGFIVGINYQISTDVSVEGEGIAFGSFPIETTEIIAGGMIPLFEDDLQRLSLLIKGGYMLDKIGPQAQTVSFSVGFSYFFKVTSY